MKILQKITPITLTIICLLNPNMEFAQSIKRALFIGNSYTGVNNLPLLTKDLAYSAGDSLIIDSHTPGGQTFQGHFADPIVQSKIAQGNWDFVILQEQSQRPSFPDSQVEVEVFPYAQKLDSMIRLYNPCGETLFYMTWGRKFGDASNCQFWPPVCTYEGMDSLLYLRYMQMAENNQAAISPVGKLWNYIRQQNSTIELYSSDNSHPSLAGSYAAACAFYACIFRKDPTQITNDYGLNSSEAAYIRNAAKTIVFDDLSSWNVGTFDLQANANVQSINLTSVSFENTSQFATEYSWNFGDGNYSSEIAPTHQYQTIGTYTVQLIATDDCNHIDTAFLLVTIETNSVMANEVVPDVKVNNPFYHELSVENLNGYFSLFTLDGKCILEERITEKGIIHTHQLPQGVYIAHFKDEKGTEFSMRLFHILEP